jgi:excisionase family DNA binding protein
MVLLNLFLFCALFNALIFTSTQMKGHLMFNNFLKPQKPTPEPTKEHCAISISGLMTPRDAALYLGIKINTLAVWRMTKKYNLPYIKVGNRVKYSITDLDNWLKEHRKNDYAE